MLVDMMAEEIEVANAKRALLGVDDYSILVEALENESQVFEVLVRGGAGHEEIVDVCVAERETAQDVVDEALKRLCRIAKTKWHAQEFE